MSQRFWRIFRIYFFVEKLCPKFSSKTFVHVHETPISVRFMLMVINDMYLMPSFPTSLFKLTLLLKRNVLLLKPTLSYFHT